MSDVSRRNEHYRPPERIEAPPIYRWPPQPAKALAWLLGEFLFPWGLAFIALAIVTWVYLTPDYARMAVLEPGWIGYSCLSRLRGLYLPCEETLMQTLHKDTLN